MELFERHGFHPRGDLGQNFLIDLNLIEYIVRSGELDRSDVVLEIGAGTGGMTTFLSEEAGAVVSVEYDSNMHGLAREAIDNRENVTLLHLDALHNKNNFAPEVLETVRAKLAEDPARGLKLVANLPYNIATPVISNLVASELPWRMMVVTIQWELAERMRAHPRSSDYGALSVWLQSQCRVKTLKKLGPTVFWPRPKVDSAIVRLLPDPRLRQQIVDREFFHDFVRRAFLHRRKHLRSVLVGMYRKQLEKTDVDAVLEPFALKDTVRAEELDFATHVQLSNAFREKVGPLDE